MPAEYFSFAKDDIISIVFATIYSFLQRDFGHKNT